MLGSSLQPPAPVPGPTAASPAPSSSSCLSASSPSAPSPSGSPFHHLPSPHPHHPHPHHHPSPHHFGGGGGHRAPGGLRVPWPPPASNHPSEGFGRFGGGLYSLFPAPAAAVSNSPSADSAVYSPSPSPSSPAASPAGTPFASAEHYHSFIAAPQKESLFSSTFSFNGGPGGLVGTGLQAHFSNPHVGLLAPVSALERGITNLEMMAKKGYGVDKPPSSDASHTSGTDCTNKMAVAKDHGIQRQQQQQRRGQTSAQHWPEVRFIMPKAENGTHGQQQFPCSHDPIPSPVDLHNNISNNTTNNNRRRGSKRRWPDVDVPETNSAKMEARSACACLRATHTTTTTPSTTSSSTSTTILTIPTSIPMSQSYQPRGSSVATYHMSPKADLTCKRNGTDPSANAEIRMGGSVVREEGRRLSGCVDAEEEQRKSSGGGCSRTTPVSLRCPRDSSTPTAHGGARPGSSTPQSPLTLHHSHHPQQLQSTQQTQGNNQSGLLPQADQWNGAGLLQLQVTVKKENGSEGSGSAGTTPCQVAEVTTSRSSAEGATPVSASNDVSVSDPNPIAALSQMPLLCMPPNAVLLKSIKVEEGPMPPSPGVVSPTTTSTTPVGCGQPQSKDCNGRQTPMKRQQHSKSKKESMPPYPEIPLSSASNSASQAAIGRQRVEGSAPRLAPLPHMAPVSLPQLDKRTEAAQATAGGLLLVRGPEHQKGRHKGATDVSQTPSTPTLTVSAPSAMVAPVPACNAPSAEQLTSSSISASAIAAPGAAVLQSAPCEGAASAGEVAAAVAAAVANGMHSWAGPAPLHHSPGLTPPHHLHHHHTLWLGQGQTFPAPVPLQLGASQAQPTDAQHVPLPPVGYQLVRDPLTGQLLLIPTTNLAEHLQRAAAAAAAAVVWPSFPSALPPHASATSPHLHQLMLQPQPQQQPQQHIQLFPSSQQHPQQAHSQAAAEHHQAETEYRILFQHQIHQQQQQQQHQHRPQSHQLQQPPTLPPPQDQQPPTLVIPNPVHDFVKKKEDGDDEGTNAASATLVGGHPPAGILIAVPKVEVVEPEEEDAGGTISVDDVKPGIAVAASQAGFLHPHQQHLGHARRDAAELIVPGVATIGAVVSPTTATSTGVAASAPFPPYVFPGSAVAATSVAASAAVNSTPAVQYFYEHTGMVRMTTAQPSAVVQTESGRRSQGTSPVNPADTCLTPPPETPCVATEVPEEMDLTVGSRGSNMKNSTGGVENTLLESELKPSSSSSPSVVASCSAGTNTTDMVEPIPDRHDVRTTSTETESSGPPISAVGCVNGQELEDTPVQVQDAGNQTEMTMGSDDDSTAMLINASSDEATCESAQHVTTFTASADAMTSTDSQDAQSLPMIPKAPRLVVIQPPLQSPIPPNNQPSEGDEKLSNKACESVKVCVNASESAAVDLSGLELLSNSIEQFESNRTLDMPRLEKHEIARDSDSGKSRQKEEKHLDEYKVEDESLEVAPRLDIEASIETASEEKTDIEKSNSDSMKQEQNSDSSNGFAGGLGLLCALAEQRFMEEVAMSEPGTNQTSSWPKDEAKNSPVSPPSSSSSTSRNSVDIHRNYKSPKSEREIKAFIASKVSQYQGQNNASNSQMQPFQYSQVQQNLFQSILSANSSGGLGSKGFGSSPSSSSAITNGGSTSTGSTGSCSGSFGGTSDVMDAMELDMRMRLAELQRKYREKQRELSRLQHSRTKATGDEATTASGAESCALASSDNPSPTKRGPGRPRKQGGKKLANPQLNSALSASRRGSSSSSGSSSCGGASPQKELSPPVLEKVTEVMALRKRRRRRQRKALRRHHKQKCGYSEDEDDDDETGDEEDGGPDKGPAETAPKLRLASKDILKPPTLTANRIINCARFKPEETHDGLSSEASMKAFKLPQCNVNLVKLKTSTISGKVKSSDLSPVLSRAGTSCDTKAKLGAGVEKLPNGSSLLVSASSASGASWLARNTQNNSYITTTTTTTSSNTSDQNGIGGNISNNDSSSLSPFQYRNTLLNPSSPSPLNGKALLAPSSLRIPPTSVPSVRKQSLSCYTFGSKQLTPSLLSSGEKQRLESLTSDSSMLWFLKPDSDASKEPAVGVGGFSPSQKAEEKRVPLAGVGATTTATTTTTNTETAFGNNLINGRKRKAISSASQLPEKAQQQNSSPQSLRSSPSTLSSSSSSSTNSSPSSSPAFKKRKPGRPKKHSTRAKTTPTETIVAKKMKKKSVVGFMVGPPAPSDPPTDSRAPLTAPAPSTISAPASPATASTAPSQPPCPSPHKPKIKPKLKAEAKVKSSLSCDDEDDWIQLQPSIPSPIKGRRRVFDDSPSSSPALAVASPASFVSASVTSASRPTWNGDGCPPSLVWGASSSGNATTPNAGGSAETSPSKAAAQPPSGGPQATTPRKKKLASKSKLALAKRKAAALLSAQAAASASSSSTSTTPASSTVPVAAIATAEPEGGNRPDLTTLVAPEKRRRSGERAATTQDLLRSLKKRQTRIQSAGGSVGGGTGIVGGASTSLTGVAAAAKVTVRSRSFADNHESSSYSEGENVPLIALKERPTTPVPRSCKITQEDLHDGLRALTSPDGGGLLYAGQIHAIQAPDVYGITLDGERGHRPHIYSREEILKDAFAEVRPGSIRHLQPGTRVCAYWSQQYRCLYPGTVAAPSSPDPELDRRFVGVEFDDGDSGRININDIRLLPQDFPVVDYDPNPLMSLARRRRRASGASASGGLGDGVITKEKKDPPPPVPGSSAPTDETTSTTTAVTCDSSLAVSKPKKRKKEVDKDGDSTVDTEIRKKSSYWKEMEKTLSASSTSASNSGSALAEADSSGLPMPGSKMLSVTKKLTAAEKEKRRMRKREKARKRDKLRRQQLLAAKIAATALNCDELSGSSGNVSTPLSSDISTILKKKHKKHRSNKCDEKCMLIGKKHRHHHHHRKHHRHHHHKHRHHRRGSKHCVGSTVSGLLTSGNTISSEISTESLVAESKESAPSPVKVAHTKRKKKKKKTEGKVKETVPAPPEAAPIADAGQTSTSDTNEAPSSVAESQENLNAEEVEKTSTSKEEVTQPETAEASSKKALQKNAKKDNAGGAATSKIASTTPARKQRDRQPSVESRSKMAAFLPARQLWRWSGRGFKRPGAKGRGKKEFYKSIQRGKETIKVGDCAVFLSTGRPDRPYIGSIESMWESWGGNMVVRVKWFYHPEETKGGPSLEALKFPGALFQSPHIDENDVQTISHKCEVLAFGDYRKRMGDGGTGDEMEPSRYASVYDNNDVYYLAGHYDPTNAVLTMEADIAKS